MTSNPGLVEIATYLPSQVVENAALVESFGFQHQFLEEKLGISRRHIAAADESVSDMAVEAGRRLISRLSLNVSKLGALIVVTQNPDFKLPATANIVQHRLELPQSIAAFDINQGCSGYVYGLSVAKGLIRTHNLNSALLVTSEAYSKVIDTSDRSVKPLFGDGATASLIVPGGRGQIGEFTFGSDGSGADDLIVKGGGSRHPSLSCSGAGALSMNGRSIYNFMMRRVPVDVAACMTANCTCADKVDLFLFHQASRYMVEALASSMGIPADKAPVRLNETGNTVSSSIPMLIDALGGLNALAGKTALLSGFGVGLSWASTLIRFDGTQK